MAFFGSANSRPGSRRRVNRGVQSNKTVDSSKKHGTSSWLNGLDWHSIRLRIVAVLFVLVWTGLWVRAGQVQLFDGPFLAERARRQHMSSELVDTPRGMIVDRNGRIMARSVECRSVSANPSAITDMAATSKELAAILNLPEERVRGLIDNSKRFVWVLRRIDDATAEAVRRAALPGIELVREYERIYPYKQVAGQLLGFVGMDGHGLEGIERAYDQVLASTASKQFIQRDAKGRRYFVPAEDNIPEAETLQLSLDIQVQFIAEDVLARSVESTQSKWAGVLIVDVENGDVLAWAQHPFFNPNAYRSYTPNIYRNRLALDALEPGSTFKPFLIASALQENIITRETPVFCENGTWRSKYITIRDDGRSYGEIPVHSVLSLSSNIGCGKIGLKLGPTLFHRYLTELGFGAPTPLNLNQTKGILRKPRDWSEADIITSAFGQSLSVSAVQMAQGYLTLANKGVYMPMNLVMNEELRQSGGGQRIFSAATTREVLRMMREVVDTGTGKNAAIPGVSVAGKTGTAQKADKSGRYGAGRLASFVGMAPAENPRYLVVIMLDEPSIVKYGGAIAAPVFREVASRMLAYYGALPDAGAAALATAKLTPRERKDLERKATQERKAAEKKLKTQQAAESNHSGEVRNVLAGQAKAAPGGQVPDVMGQSVRRAVEMFARQGLVPLIMGEGQQVIRQEPPAGATVTHNPDQPCTLWLSEI